MVTRDKKTIRNIAHANRPGNWGSRVTSSAASEVEIERKLSMDSPWTGIAGGECQIKSGQAMAATKNSPALSAMARSRRLVDTYNARLRADMTAPLCRSWPPGGPRRRGDDSSITAQIWEGFEEESAGAPLPWRPGRRQGEGDQPWAQHQHEREPAARHQRVNVSASVSADRSTGTANVATAGSIDKTIMIMKVAPTSPSKASKLSD